MIKRKKMRAEIEEIFLIHPLDEDDDDGFVDVAMEREDLMLLHAGTCACSSQ